MFSNRCFVFEMLFLAWRPEVGRGRASSSLSEVDSPKFQWTVEAKGTKDPVLDDVHT